MTVIGEVEYGLVAVFILRMSCSFFISSPCKSIQGKGRYQQKKKAGKII